MLLVVNYRRIKKKKHVLIEREIKLKENTTVSIPARRLPYSQRNEIEHQVKELESVEKRLTKKQNEIKDLHAKICEINKVFTMEIKEKCRELSEVVEVRKNLELSVEELKKEVFDVTEKSMRKENEYMAMIEVAGTKCKDVENEKDVLKSEVEVINREKAKVVNGNCKLIENINVCQGRLKDISQEKLHIGHEPLTSDRDTDEEPRYNLRPRRNIIRYEKALISYLVAFC